MKKIIIFLIITLLFLSITCLANNYSKFDKELEYEYSFSKKYVVAGERVLDLTITNNSSYNIEALKMEIRLLDPFKEIVSDWSTFMDPEFKLLSGKSKSLSLSLNTKNILGVDMGSVLDKAKYVKLRYSKVLLENGKVLTKKDLYDLESNYKSYKIDIKPLSKNNKRKYDNFEISLTAGGKHYDFIDKYNLFEISQSDLPSRFYKKYIALMIKIKNVSDKALKKDWCWFSIHDQKNSFIFVDDKKNQYGKISLVYELKNLKGIVSGDLKLMPGVKTNIIFALEKINNYTPKHITIYIDGKKIKKIQYQLRK